ncbi:MAG: hypothetical protein H0X34_02250 [Chthoniobacterales bacterium]|nr:hypothetical protein [Chthoniobacterales bacterium]
MFDAIVYFVSLFAIAVLPYAVQTFLRFTLSISSFGLYASDFSLILLSLSILRVRSLRQRRHDPDLADRPRAWRHSLIQFAFALLLAGMLLALQRHGGAFRSGLRDLDGYIIGMFVATVLLISTFARRLPDLVRQKK